MFGFLEFLLGHLGIIKLSRKIVSYAYKYAS